MQNKRTTKPDCCLVFFFVCSSRLENLNNLDSQTSTNNNNGDTITHFEHTAFKCQLDLRVWVSGLLYHQKKSDLNPEI